MSSSHTRNCLVVFALVAAISCIGRSAIAVPTGGGSNAPSESSGTGGDSAERATVGPKAAPTSGPRQSAGAAIKVIIGLSLLGVLAFIASHPLVKQFQAAIGVSQIMAAGFPFVALGLVARHPAIGVLTDATVAQMTPLLNFGLGWLGFMIGTQLDVRFLDRLPRGTAFLVLVEASVPFATTALACGGLLLVFVGDIREPALWRDILLLGAAGAMTAAFRSAELADNRSWAFGGEGIAGLVSQLDEIAGIACLLFMAAFWRPEGSPESWSLPGTAWVFVTLGLGVALGMAMFVMVRAPERKSEFLAILIGFVAFGSGLAGYLLLSPIVVCFIAGVFITNFPCDQRGQLIEILEGFERPIHLIFLIIVGATWDVTDWRGWAIVPCFVVSRFLGRWLGMFSGRKAFEARRQAIPAHGAAVTPMSALSIALVVSVQQLYHDALIAWVMTAVIGGAIATEFVVQLVPTWMRDPGGHVDPERFEPLGVDADPTRERSASSDDRRGEHPG